MMSNSKNSIRFIAIAAVIAISLGIYTQQSQQSEDKLPSLNKAVILPNSKALNHIDFTDHNGAAFGIDRLKGYWNILFFGFTNCPDICPTTMRTLSQVKQTLEQENKWGNYRVIMVSVDPERDTQERLKNYVPYFDEDFIGLRSDVETTTKFAKQLGILFVKQKSEDGFYQVDHGASIVLVNPQGEMAGVITAPHQQDLISNDLALLADYFEDDHANKVASSAAVNQSSNNISTAENEHPPETGSRSSTDNAQTIEGLVISQAWIRPAPPNANSMAGYFKLENKTDTDISLVGAQSESFAMAMIHDTVIENEIAKMQHLDKLVIPANSEITLAPLGMHLMLMRPHEPLDLGDSASVTLISETGAELTQSIEVKQQDIQ